MKKMIIVVLGVLMFSDVLGQCLPVADNVTLLDSWKNPLSTRDFSDVWGYVAPDGSEYAITGDQDSVYIIDVSDPTDINLVYHHDQGDRSRWRDFKVYGHHLYSIADQNFSINDNGIVVYDLSGLPSTVTKVAELNSEFEKAHNIYVDVENARLYAAGLRSTRDFCVYDLSSNPGNPPLLKCVDLDTVGIGGPSPTGVFYIHDLFVKDNILYASHGYTGYYIWDLTDLDQIQQVGFLDNSFFDSGYVHSSWNSDDDNHAVVATEVGTSPMIYWIDQSDPSNMKVLDQYKEPLCNDSGNLGNKRPHNPYIIGDKIYTSLYHDGLHVLEIDFAEDTLGRVGYYDTYPDNINYNSLFEGNWGAYPYLPSGTILASDITHGLFTLRYDGPPTYTFLGPGVEWSVDSNWYNDEIPPVDFTGSVVISSNCVKDDASIFPDGAKIIVNTGASFSQE